VSPAAFLPHEAWLDRGEALARRIAAADLATLVALAPELRAVAGAMIEADAGAGLLTRALARLGDLLTVRAIALCAPRHRLPPASWCWLAFGSEGRGEQTFVTDQDNGIVFSAADAAEARALRPLFLAFAQEVNQVLADCGYALCAGGIMAGNPACCLSLAEWRERFAAWVRTPEPEALLNATIFFDFRALHGDRGLEQALRTHLAQCARGADAFLRMFADNALAAAPPLGFVREFAARDGLLDLKKFGARIFVDAARILGLACPSPATADRLGHAAAAGVLPALDAHAARGAFLQLQRIRLREQWRALAAGDGADNRVDPRALDPFDRRVLYEAFKQARQLQQRLKITFRIEG
jgi:CBS domain-containing protein